MRVERSINIDAPAQRVWDVLADIEHWPEWTASMKRVERLDSGPLTMGSKVRVEQPRLPSAVWEVTDAKPGKSFDWETRRMGVRLSGGHTVVPRGEDGATVTLTFAMRGPIASILAPFAAGTAKRYVEMEANGLKRRAEGARAT